MSSRAFKKYEQEEAARHDYDDDGIPERRLKPEYQALADEFDAKDSCCSCHLNPPCGHCTHPGNPANLEEDVDAWEYFL